VFSAVEVTEVDVAHLSLEFGIVVSRLDSPGAEMGGVQSQCREANDLLGAVPLEEVAALTQDAAGRHVFDAKRDICRRLQGSIAFQQPLAIAAMGTLPQNGEQVPFASYLDGGPSLAEGEMVDNDFSANSFGDSQRLLDTGRLIVWPAGNDGDERIVDRHDRQLVAVTQPAQVLWLASIPAGIAQHFDAVEAGGAGQFEAAVGAIGV